MAKLIAILNVVAWAGFWAFGYLALTAEAADAAHVTIAAVLAFLGAGIGIFAWFWLVRHSEDIGYAPRPPQAPREHHRAADDNHVAGGNA